MIKKNKFINDFDLSSQLYFNEISKYKPLSIDEELKLWKQYKYNNDLKARDKLITSNLKFVASVAKGYQGRGLSYSDLIAEGNCGLLKAIDKFDFKKGYKTISYSVWWIRQSILEALKERNILNSEELPSDFEKQQNEEDEIVEEPTKIDFSFEYENENTDNEEVKNIIKILTKCLNKRELIIVSRYYGLDGECLTLEEIGRELNLTKERIRQILEKSLKKLRTEALTNSITTDIYK